MSVTATEVKFENLPGYPKAEKMINYQSSQSRTVNELKERVAALESMVQELKNQQRWG